MNTETQYKDLQDKIESNIILLQEKLKEHKIKFENNPTNWGYIGDLTYLNTRLDNILESFE